MFANFYTDLGGTARCFDIFDADDDVLWHDKSSVRFVFVFACDRLANAARQCFHPHLREVTADMLGNGGNSSSNASNDIEWCIWYVFFVHGWWMLFVFLLKILIYM